MKHFRGTLIFTLIVLAVGIFTLQEFKKSKTEQEEKVTQDHIFRNFKSEEVVSWALSEKYVLKKSDSGWKIFSPVEDDADNEAVNSFFRSVFTQTVESLDVAREDNNKRYGFDVPLGVFEFSMLNGEKHKIILGSVLTYDKGYYIKKDNDETIWVGSSGWAPFVSKTYNDLRLKSIKFGEGELSKLRLKYKVEKDSADLEFKKVGANWQYESNAKMQIDGKVIEDLFRNLKDLKAEAILEDRTDTASIKKQNLTKANLTIEASLLEGAKNQDVKVSFYLPQTGDVSYMSTANTPIYSTSLSKAKEFIKNLDAFRDKTFLFNFDQNLAKKIEIKKFAEQKTDKNASGSSSSDYKFEKLVTDWVLQNAPDADAGAGATDNTGDLNKKKQASQPEVLSFLSELKSLKAETFNGDAKKFKTVGEIFLYKEKNELLFSISYGGLHKGSNGSELYLAKTNLSNEIVGVSRSSIDVLTSKKLIEDLPEKKTKEQEQAKLKGDK